MTERVTEYSLLSHEVQRQILDMHGSGARITEIAAKTGVSRFVVDSLIRQGAVSLRFLDAHPHRCNGCRAMIKTDRCVYCESMKGIRIG